MTKGRVYTFYRPT